MRSALLSGDLRDLRLVRLRGSRCATCKTVLLGQRRRCENCSSVELSDEVFGEFGSVFTYTIQRYPPPRPYPAPDPWVVRGLAWIDIDDGPRILAPVAATPEQMSIGMRVRLVCEIGWLDAERREVVAFHYVPLERAC